MDDRHAAFDAMARLILEAEQAVGRDATRIWHRIAECLPAWPNADGIAMSAIGIYTQQRIDRP